MSYELIALMMFASMMLMLMTGQRVFGAIGAVAVIAALSLWGDGGVELAFASAMKLMKWYPLLTLPLFIYMGYMLSESGIADDLYRMFHVWSGGLRCGLAVGAIGQMVVISAMNGLSVAVMAIGASIALPELLRRGYDKIMVTGVIQGGSSLGIVVPPSVAPVSIPYEDAEVAVQTGELDGMAWSGITKDYTVGWATNVIDYITTNNISGAWIGSFYVNEKQWSDLPPHLKQIYLSCVEASHTFRNQWYWGGEARLRATGDKLALTTVPAAECREVGQEAQKFWNEIAQTSARAAKVVQIFKDYNAIIDKAGTPYTCG